MPDTPVKDFWMDPKNPPVNINFNSFKFGYTEQNGKQREYIINMLIGKPEGQLSFHRFVFAIRKYQRRGYLPWPHINDLKKNVLVVPVHKDLDAAQLQLDLGMD
jgi:hypothetical protein